MSTPGLANNFLMRRERERERDAHAPVGPIMSLRVAVAPMPLLSPPSPALCGAVSAMREWCRIYVGAQCDVWSLRVYTMHAEQSAATAPAPSSAGRSSAIIAGFTSYLTTHCWSFEAPQSFFPVKAAKLSSQMVDFPKWWIDAQTVLSRHKNRHLVPTDGQPPRAPLPPPAGGRARWLHGPPTHAWGKCKAGKRPMQKMPPR